MGPAPQGTGERLVEPLRRPGDRPDAGPAGSAQASGWMPAGERRPQHGPPRPADSPMDGRALSRDRAEAVGWPCEATIWHVVPEPQPPAGGDPAEPSPAAARLFEGRGPAGATDLDDRPEGKRR
jgi:hypothetical protein